jgi:ribose/xylose/arabinose/galactoside ABC-type transport system permease subunit
VLHLVQDVARLPQDAASGCQTMLFWSGVAGVAGTIAVVTLDAVRRRALSLIAAEGVAGAGLLLLWGAVELVRVDLAPATLPWLRVPVVMAAMLLTMGGVSWTLRAVWRDGAMRGRTLVILASGCGVFLLAGLTPIDRVEVPAPLLILLAIAVLAVLFLDFTIYGRYLLALGRNEEAARYSGINTAALMVTAYVLCALLAGIAGILFALDVNSVQPSVHGNFYELYAIAAAVLGGCSLRGGEGSILGVIIGTAVIRVLYNAINFLGIPTQLEFAVLGAVILAGVAADELMKRWRKE